MIEARIYKDEVEVGRIRISNLEMHADDSADYLVEFAVERIGAVGLHTRTIRFFPRLKYNVLALLFQALRTLEAKEFELEPNTSPPDLARRLRGLGPSPLR